MRPGAEKQDPSQERGKGQQGEDLHAVLDDEEPDQDQGDGKKDHEEEEEVENQPGKEAPSGGERD